MKSSYIVALAATALFGVASAQQPATTPTPTDAEKAKAKAERTAAAQKNMPRDTGHGLGGDGEIAGGLDSQRDPLPR